MKWDARLPRANRLIMERLADKLDGSGAYAKVGPVPKHKFDMTHYFADEKGGEPMPFAWFDPAHCKSAACAIGWATSDRWFNRRGINAGSCGGSKFFEGMDENDFVYYPIDPFEWLFTDIHYRAVFPEPKTVATRIRKFVADHI